MNLIRIEEARSNCQAQSEVKVDIRMIILVIGPYSEQAISPQKHDTNQAKPIKTELCRRKFNVILELSVHLEVLIDEPTNQLAIDGAEHSNNTHEQKVKLHFIYPNSIFKVVDDEHEDGSEEIDGVDDGKGQVELGGGDGQSVNHHDDVSL